MARVGWKRLPGSGLAYHGTIRPGDVVLDGPPPPPEPSAVVEQPAKDARKQVWAEYARSLGLDVKGLTRVEIIKAVEELVEAVEDEAPVGGEVAGVDLPADPEEPGAGPGHEEEA